MNTNPLLSRLCDDAAIFPPGLAPLPQAVADHDRHRRSGHADLVGPLVVSSDVLGDLASLTAGREVPLAVIVTAPTVAEIPAAASLLATLPGIVVAGFEVPVSEADPAADIAVLAVGAAQRHPVTVEVPRFLDASPEQRPRLREAVLDRVVGTGLTVKFRTGGATSHAHPGAPELAHAVAATVQRGLRFKATAGLHHLVRNDDSGRSQHGFGNLLLATQLALLGRPDGELAEVLDLTDRAEVAARLAALDHAAARRLRDTFTSFGTCSIVEPLTDLVAAGLLAPTAVPPQE